MPPVERCLVWLRRDLRLADNRALAQARRTAKTVWVAFVFDEAILRTLPREDRRVEFIRESLVELDQRLRAQACEQDAPSANPPRLLVVHGDAVDVLPRLAATLGVQRVMASHDDDPYALARDAQVRERLSAFGAELLTVKDHVVFERREVLTATGTPFSVFTPYKNAWLRRLQPSDLEPADLTRPATTLAPFASVPASLRAAGVFDGVPTLADIGFRPTNLASLRLPTGEKGALTLLHDFLDRIDAYEDTRNFPAVKGPSYLSVHLRFGTVSIRQLAREAWQRMQGGSRGAEVWLSELIWRDFYHQVLHHHPQVVTRSFKPAYDRIEWAHGAQADAHFNAWCEGRTGYPIVDAAMAQINQSGYMHNRLRMVVASFLTKDLGIDWRCGETYFAQHLLDFDLAANNGGWQWAASSGCDAQPYFRIFNPVSQSEKFDPQGRFIRRYLPALASLPDAAIHAPWLAKPVDMASAGLQLGRDYPEPVVAHDEARRVTLARYAVVKSG
jgi:deoxyribodipyrimidine photo-lyase